MTVTPAGHAKGFEAGTLLMQQRNAAPPDLKVLDITNWFGETTAGAQVYLKEKGDYVGRHPGLRQVVVTPSHSDSVEEHGPVRHYRLKSPRIPTQPHYRLLLAAASLRRIIEHEYPDLIEVHSPIILPWLTAIAARRRDIPLVGFHHTGTTKVLRGGHWNRPMSSLSAAYARRLDRLFVTTLVASDYAASELAAAGAKRITRVPAGPATAGRGFVKSEYSWDRVFDPIFEVYRRIVRVHSD
ncbi:MAG: glycosyltransferase [Gemmatimonadota bacterium]|nr:glycosyltransferase [Gemmatimonadota bacterium]